MSLNSVRHKTLGEVLGSAKSDHKGRSLTSAINRLKSEIILHLLQKLHEDFCYVCGKNIKNVKELSIEHKIPYEKTDAKLFWDINNIAFSHRKCNKSHNSFGNSTLNVERAVKRRKIGPIGTAYCGACEKFLSIDNFCKMTRSWQNLNRRCRKCESARHAKRKLKK